MATPKLSRALLRALSEMIGARGSRRWLAADQLRRMRGATPMSNILLGAKTRGPGAFSNSLAEGLRYTPEERAANERYLQAAREAGLNWRPGIDREDDLLRAIDSVPKWRQRLLLMEMGDDFSTRGPDSNRLWHRVWRTHWKMAQPHNLAERPEAPSLRTKINRERALSGTTMDELIADPSPQAFKRRLGVWGEGGPNSQTPLLSIPILVALREAMMQDESRG